MKYAAKKMTGMCLSGAETDSGRLAHAVEPVKGYFGWQKAACGASPGKRGNGWSVYVESEVTCTRCLAKIALEAK